MVGFAPGGATDIAFRAIAEQAARYLGQPVIVDPRPGAGATLPAQYLQSAHPDGYTIAHIGVGIYRLPYTTKLAWDPFRDIVHVVRLGGYPLGAFTVANGPMQGWADLAARARHEPGAVPYGTGGQLTASHVTMELVCERLGLRMNHIPYRGGTEVRQALLSGLLAAGVDAIGPQHVSSGQFKVLCIWTERRQPSIPDVPTLIELGVPIVETSSYGIGAPRGTPAAVVARLHDAFKYALEQPVVQEVFAREGLLPQYLDSAAYLDSVQRQYANERKTLERLGLVPAST